MFGAEKSRAENSNEIKFQIRNGLKENELLLYINYFGIKDVYCSKLYSKYKEKLVSHRKGEGKTGSIQPETSSMEESGRIIKNKKFELKPMSPDEAAMQMELLDKDFFVFTNDGSGNINVIYRRKDGNFGLIEPME